MEVDKTNKKVARIRHYLDRYHHRSYLLVITSSIGAGFIFTAILLLCELVELFTWQFWLVLLMTSSTLVIIGVGLFWKLSKPFEELVHSVIAATESSHSTPNLSDYSVKDGDFQHLLQSVYDLNVREEPVIEHEVSEVDEDLRLGLDQTSSGIVFLDEEQNITFNNKNAPVRINREGDKFINLIFPDTDTLPQWIAECQDNTVHAERIWTRVADKPAGEPNRHIYDVVASFQKNNPAETVITFFDRSSTYAPEEDDLDFISFAAHELRGPITVIRGYLDVIDEELGPTLQNDQKELMQRLIVSANRLSSYINNILNASRYDRRHFKIRLSEESVKSIYNTIRDDMQLRATSQHRTLSIDIPKGLPTVAADKNSIGEVMSNLIDNAIKYSNEGGHVVVQARAISGFIEVSVIDRGIGMPASVIPNLFHKFYRSHRSRETVAGTGIGLYLSKAIVESHGGSIEVRSTESEGSTFAFTLPIYSTVAEKIKASNNSNELLIVHGGGWIRNHSLYRG